MSLWEFMTAMQGFARFHGGAAKAATQDFTDAQLREMGVEGF